MAASVLLVAVAALALSAFLTRTVLRRARSGGLIDVPNQRSSHQLPTPTGGGTSIVIAATVGFMALFALGAIDVQLLAAASGGLLVAVAGFIDDRRRLSARVRIVVHTLAALWALFWLGGLHALRFDHFLWTPHAFGYVLGVLGVVWTINLFNFMDGIDGLAVSEAIFMAGAAALLGASAGAAAAPLRADLLFAAACAGFALWNWPPARIFMGDVGSGYVGYLLAILALSAARDSEVALLVWLTLGGVFFVDATVTLTRRCLRGERVYEAHRSHAYQWLARRWGSHRRTTVTMLLVNVAWLLPCAGFETAFPQYAARITLLALAPLTVLAFGAGAGRSEAG